MTDFDGLAREIYDRQLLNLIENYRRVYNKDMNYFDEEDFDVFDREVALEEVKGQFIDDIRCCFEDKRNRFLVEIENFVNNL